MSAFTLDGYSISGFSPEDVRENSYKAPVFGACMGAVGLLSGVVLKISVLATGAFFALSFGTAACVHMGLRYLAAEEIINWKAYHLLSAASFFLIPTVSAIVLVATGVFTAPILYPAIGFALLTAAVPLTFAFIDDSDNIFSE